MLSDAGATWTIVPQPGDLTDVDTGFSTTKGTFSSKWSNSDNSFRLSISTPKGTKGTIGIPLPRKHGKALLRQGKGRAEVVHGDSTGRYWIKDLSGGDYEIVANAL